MCGTERDRDFQCEKIEERVGYIDHSFRISVRKLNSNGDKNLDDSESAKSMSNLLFFNLCEGEKTGAFGESCWWGVDDIADVVVAVIVLQ